MSFKSTFYKQTFLGVIQEGLKQEKEPIYETFVENLEQLGQLLVENPDPASGINVHSDVYSSLDSNVLISVPVANSDNVNLGTVPNLINDSNKNDGANDEDSSDDCEMIGENVPRPFASTSEGIPGGIIKCENDPITDNTPFFISVCIILDLFKMNRPK